MEFSVFSLWPLPLVLSLGPLEKSLTVVFTPSIRFFIHIGEIVLIFALSRLNTVPALRLTWSSGAPDPLLFLWPFAAFLPVYPCVSCPGKPRAGHSTPGCLTSAEQRAGDPADDHGLPWNLQHVW